MPRNGTPPRGSGALARKLWRERDAPGTAGETPALQRPSGFWQLAVYNPDAR
jgi:hypothetical protein